MSSVLEKSDDGEYFSVIDLIVSLSFSHVLGLVGNEMPEAIFELLT